MGKKILFVIGVVFIVFLIGSINATWWNDSWSYKKAISLNLSSGTTEGNFPVELNITHNVNMNSNFSDLRFTNALEDTELDYWVEEKIDDNHALIWVKIDQNITTTSQVLTYMYYGNSAATSNSNGDSTFDFFDDFSSANTTKWNASIGSLTVSNGEAVLNRDSLHGDRAFSYGFAFETRTYANISSLDAGGMWIDDQRVHPDLGSDQILLIGNYNPVKLNPQTTNDGTTTENSSTGIDYPSEGTVHRIALVSSSSLKYFQGDALISSFTTNIPNNTLYPGMRHWAGNSVYNFDWYRVRKWNDADLNYSLGIEEVPLQPQNATFENVNATDTLNAETGLFSFLGSSISRIAKGWFTEINVIDLIVDIDTLFVDSSEDRVGIGTTSPERKLHINDTLKLEPRNSAPSNGTEGDIYFDSTLHKLCYHDGFDWKCN